MWAIVSNPAESITFREEMMELILELDPEGAPGRLRVLVDDPVDQMRRSAYRAAGRLDLGSIERAGPQTVASFADTLRALLRRSEFDPDLREDVARALKTIGGPDARAVAQKVEAAIEPTRVRGCLIFAPPFPAEMPESARQHAVSGAWQNAQKETPGLREQVRGLSVDPSDFELELVASQDVDLPEATAAVVSVWRDGVLPAAPEPHYREFFYGGRIDFPGAGAHFQTFLTVLVFGMANG
jgi:hypothetical protein